MTVTESTDTTRTTSQSRQHAMYTRAIQSMRGGTEATMHAMRVARAFTGRDKIVKFEGQYHGVHDYALISVLANDVSSLGNRDNPVRLAWGRGIPETVVPVPYNDLSVLR